MDLFEDDAPKAGDNSPELTVSEVAGAVKKTIEGEFGHVRIRGEVGRVSRPASGHIYFNLKDDRASLDAVTWKGQAARLTVRPEEGLEVIATGRLTTFPGASKYQMIVEDMQPAGAGALMAMLEKRRQALAAEGLFDPARKKPLPFLPEVIGVITSPSGAVIRDILHRLRDRFPRKVLVWPVPVQGQQAAGAVANAIRGFNAFTPGGALPRPDVLIVARGGGSIEDLWAFNEEIVVRAAADSRIPLISAVGHETDTTLIDYAADVRAPTPTAAAELSVPVRAELMGYVAQLGARLTQATSQHIRARKQRLSDLSRALPRAETLTGPAAQRLDMAAQRLPAALKGLVQARHVRLARAALQPQLLRQRIAAERRGVTATADRLPAALRALVSERKNRVARLSPQPHLLRQTLAGEARALTAVSARLHPAMARQIADKRRAFERPAPRLVPDLVTTRIGRLRDSVAGLDRLRVTLGYEETLKRGYAVVWADGHAVTSASAAVGTLELQFADGRVAVTRKG